MKIIHLKHYLLFAAMFAAAWYMDTYPWVKNAFVFLTVLLVLTYTHYFVTPCKKMDESYRNGDHLPESVDNFLYLALSVTLAGFAHWALAIGWILIGSADINCRQRALKQNKQ